MRVAVHQPQYLPWLGYFDKMDRADVFVLLDDVQYKKNEWQNRNKIRNAESWQWLTVPVLHKFGQRICDVEIDNRRNWREKHMRSIEMNYSHAPYSKEYIPFFREIFNKEWKFLAELNIRLIYYVKEALGIKTELIRSSSLGVGSMSTERLVDICGLLNADTYLAGAGGSAYMDTGLFDEKNIKLEFQEFSHPVYKQAHRGFEPYMSVIDLLFCQGENSLSVIKEGRKI